MRKCNGRVYRVPDQDPVLGQEVFKCSSCGRVFSSDYPYPEGYLHAHWDVRDNDVGVIS